MAVAPAAAWLFHLAQVFFLLSYLQWTLLFLRLCLFLAFFTLGLWALLATDYWTDTVAWNTVFCAINLGHIIYLLYQMRRVRLPPEQEEIYTHVFQKFGNFERLEFKKFYELGTDRYLDTGDMLSQEGRSFAELGFLVRGRVLKFLGTLEVNGICRKEQTDWAFYGSYEYINDGQMGRSVPAHLSRMVAEPNTKVHCWSYGALKRYLDKHEATRDKLIAMLCLDLVRKLGMVDQVRVRPLVHVATFLLLRPAAGFFVHSAHTLQRLSSGSLAPGAMPAPADARAAPAPQPPLPSPSELGAFHSVRSPHTQPIPPIAPPAVGPAPAPAELPRAAGDSAPDAGLKSPLPPLSVAAGVPQPLTVEALARACDAMPPVAVAPLAVAVKGDRDAGVRAADPTPATTAVADGTAVAPTGLSVSERDVSSAV